MNILAIETGVLPPLDSYLDRDNNIPPEDGNQPPPPPPAEIDPIWRDHGAFWPYVPNAPGGSSGFGSQPPSQPPSPGLSYQAPRTPSVRHRSATPSHHSSGNSQPRSAQSDPFSGRARSRSRTLMEEGNSFPPVQPWDVYDQYTPRLGRPNLGVPWGFSPADYPQEYIDGLASGKYRDIPQYTPWKQGGRPILNPDWVDPEAESSRAAACHEGLESPLAP